MHVVRRGGTGLIRPPAAITHPRDDFFSKSSLLTCKHNGRELQSSLLEFPPFGVETENRVAVLIVLAVDSAARVSVQSRSVSAPGEEVSEGTGHGLLRFRAGPGTARLPFA